jgi:serine/threonine protein kinase
MLGQTLGSYRLVAEIGKGGMGVVYLAEHTLLGRKVAVKLLHSDVHQDQVERFFDEARAAATLQHPGLIEVFDFGRRDDGSAFIVMEFLSGESLAERLQKDPRLQVPLACSITRAVANALQVAHEQGIIHRDLKPGNIFLIPDAEAAFGVRTKVLDFGIAKLHRQTESRSVRTHSGAVIGTPRYMSPEQCKNARTVDGRSDIYALGCILYEMLLGVAPFDYDTWAELVGAHLHEEPPRPHDLDPSLPADVADVVVKMLEKRPEDRYDSMSQLAQVLEGLLRARSSGTDLRLTPPSGVRTSVARGAASDPTLPASGGSSTAIPTPAASTPIPRAASPAALDDTANAPTQMPRPSPRRLGKLWLALGVVAVGAAHAAERADVRRDRRPPRGKRCRRRRRAERCRGAERERQRTGCGRRDRAAAGPAVDEDRRRAAHPHVRPQDRRSARVLSRAPRRRRQRSAVGADPDRRARPGRRRRGATGQGTRHRAGRLYRKGREGDCLRSAAQAGHVPRADPDESEALTRQQAPVQSGSRFRRNWPVKLRSGPGVSESSRRNVAVKLPSMNSPGPPTAVMFRTHSVSGHGSPSSLNATKYPAPEN